MMQRRSFLAATGAIAAGALSRTDLASAGEPGPERQLYELRQYTLTADQKAGFDAYLKESLIPALNRIGVEPVGVFYPEQGASAAYVLVPHKSAASLLECTQKLLADKEYLQKGEPFLNAPASNPAFQRVESSLLLAFRGMPQLETPVKNPGRIFQLRIYESPSVKTGQKKIEMFNDAGEITIFRRVGLQPVFFGESIVGSKMPNLTYMLGFESAEEQKASWKRFGADPDWQRLRGMDEYADKNILCNITNLQLVPADYSQI